MAGSFRASLGDRHAHTPFLHRVLSHLHGSMEEALHKGDYILVNKIPGKNKPVRGKVVLFTSPLSRDSADAPLFISRCIGMPGDTIRVSMDGYTINGQKIPRSPRSLCSYFITLSAKETFLETLEKLDIPLRDFRQENFGCMLSLTLSRNIN